MNRQVLLNQLTAMLGRFAYEVKISNSIGLFDINKLTEDFLIPIFKIAFDCPDLCNQNQIKMNFPAIDLGCKTSRLSIQITSDYSSSKAIETLEKFQSHNLGIDYSKLYVYVITERQKSYSSKNLMNAAAHLPFKFDPSTDIIDYNDLAKMFGNFTNLQLESVNEILEDQFKKIDNTHKFRRNLIEFLSICRNKIESEKQTKNIYRRSL